MNREILFRGKRIDNDFNFFVDRLYSLPDTIKLFPQ